MKRLIVLGLAVVAFGGFGTRANAQTAFALSNDGTTLVRFDLSNPSAVTTIGNFSGGASTLDAIDFRPLNGMLYGYSDSTDTLYTINTSTGALTTVASGTGTGATSTPQVGLDFNPTIDRVRVVGDNGQNLVYNPNSAAAPTVATNLFYGAGDPNNGTAPRIVDNAYTNNFAGASSTLQFGIDYSLDSLVTIANNAGTLSTIGSLGVTTGIYTGFDIYTNTVGANLAYAVLGDFNNPALYTVNLSTGAATQVGALSGISGVRSLAITPTAAPEPGTLALLTLGGLALLKFRRRTA